MRVRPGRHALPIGLSLSALAHVLLVLLNPGFEAARPRATTAARPLTVQYGRLAETLLEVTAAEAARDAVRPRATPVARAPGSAPDSVAVSGGPGAPAPVLASAADRLRAPRDPKLWALRAPAPETNEERAIREVLARLEAARDEPGFALPSLMAGRPGDFGVRIPFGRKPPPPAQVVPAPPKLALQSVDSTRPHGDLLHVYYDGLTLILPAALRAGASFQLTARLSRPEETAEVRVFVDGISQGRFTTVRGVANATLTIGTAGSHRILMHVLGRAGYAPAQLVQVVNVGS